MMRRYWILTGVIVLLSIFAGCGDSEVVDGKRLPRPGTLHTMDLIDSLISREAYTMSPTNNTARAAKFLDAYEQNKGMYLWKRYIVEQPKTGNFAQTSIIQQNSFEDGRITAEKLTAGSLIVYELMALGYLRVAIEQQGDPLIIPNGGQQSHRDPQYAQGALQLFELILSKFPDQLEHKWYYNLCHMMVGTYPDGVPSDYLIPLDTMQAYDSAIKYKEIAKEIGVSEYRNGGPAVWLDIDNDNDQDLLSFSRDLTESVQVYRNDGQSFTDITDLSGIAGLTGGAIVAPADVDNDGDLDVFVGRGKYHLNFGNMPVSLLINQGDGVFEDVAKASGMDDLLAVAGADWADYDGDGDLDLFVATESARGLAQPKLYRNDGDLRFVDIREDKWPDLMVHVMRGVELFDANGDLKTDALVTYEKYRPFLWTATDTTMHKTTSKLQWHQYTSTIVPIDVDNDGDRDMIMLPHQLEEGESTANFAKQMLESSSKPVTHLYINQGDSTFVAAHDQLGSLQYLASVYTAVPFDADLDGDMDLYVSTGGRAVGEYVPNRIYYNDGLGYFSDGTVASAAGLISQSYGLAVANIDTDPLPEIFVNGGGFYEGDHAVSTLFDPEAATNNHFVRIKLHGKTSNRFGIGAKVAVHCRQADGSKRVIYHYPEMGHDLATRQPDMPVGLGNAKAIEQIVVKWPNGEEQIVTPVELNKTITIEQEG